MKKFALCVILTTFFCSILAFARASAGRNDITKLEIRHQEDAETEPSSEVILDTPFPFEALAKPWQARIIMRHEVAILDSFHTKARWGKIVVIPKLRDGIAIVIHNKKTNQLLITHHRLGNDISTIQRYFPLIASPDGDDELKITLYSAFTSEQGSYQPELRTIDREMEFVASYLRFGLAGMINEEFIEKISYNLPSSLDDLESRRDVYTTVAVKPNGEVVNTSLLNANVFNTNSSGDWNENYQLLTKELARRHYSRVENEFYRFFHAPTFWRWENYSFFGAISLSQKRKLDELWPKWAKPHLWQRSCELTEPIFGDRVAKPTTIAAAFEEPATMDNFPQENLQLMRIDRYQNRREKVVTGHRQ